MSSQLTKLVEECETCIQRRRLPKEPLLPSPPAKRPWEAIGMDFAECKGRKYLVVVDYFSTFPFALPMTKTTAAPVINGLEELFSIFGAPDIIRSDNGPPFNSFDFRMFCQIWDINHVTSSPRYPQSNGKAEAAVKRVKETLLKGDLSLGLLAYRDAELKCGYSPAQAL